MSKRDGQIKALEAVLIAREKKVRELEGGAEHLASRYQVCVWARQCTGVGSRSRGPSRGHNLISCFVLPVCVYVGVSCWSPMVRVCWSTVHACVHACVRERENARERGCAGTCSCVCLHVSRCTCCSGNARRQISFADERSGTRARNDGHALVVRDTFPFRGIKSCPEYTI